MIRPRIGYPPTEACPPHTASPGGTVGCFVAPWDLPTAPEQSTAIAPRRGLFARLFDRFRPLPLGRHGHESPLETPGGPAQLIVDVLGPMFGRRARSLALGCMMALGGCSAERLEVEGVVRDGRTGRPIVGARVWTGGHATQTDAEGRFALEIADGATLSAHADERCDASERVSATSGRSPRVTINLFDAIELAAEHTQVGFDTDVRIEVRARCEVGPLRWTQVGGPELGEGAMRVEDDGRLLVLHTHALEELVRLDERPGVVALDREQRAEYRLALDGAGARRDVRVVAAPVSAGIYQVPTGADLYLNGGATGPHEWELLSRPEGSETALSDAAARTPRLRPDRFGTYLIEHRPSNTRMSIQAGPYDDVPRDCGREGCHRNEAEGWATTAHARTFERGLRGELGAGFTERCWSCHATGVDRGIDNGGMHQTAAQAGWVQPTPGADAWDGAPRLVRRHGSVWCSACHGPGRIVPPPYRWQYGAKLQVGVCARCHDVDADDPDANHISPHVDEWELAAMSRFVRDLRDDDPALRAGCADCHSAQGFVGWRRRGEHGAPDPDTVAPITCGTCHDAHDSSAPFGLRVHDRSDPVAGTPGEHLGSGALCATCHRAGVANLQDDDRAPHAPQADVLLGRGARLAPPREGAHRWVADTCVRCHMARPTVGEPGRGLVGGHTFSIRARRGSPDINPAACAGCHGDEAPGDIGTRDWDGDGRSGPLSEEYGRALTAASNRARRAITAADITDSCGRRASDFIDHDARLILTDRSGAMLGDCDADGVFGSDETPFTTSALRPTLRNAAYDLALLRRDGSNGVHNPEFAFRMFDALEQAIH